MLDVIALALVLHAAPAIATPVHTEPVAQTNPKSQEERRRRAARQKAAERKQNAAKGGKKNAKRAEAERRRRAKARGTQKFEMVSGMRVVRFTKPGGLKARVGPQLGKLAKEKARQAAKGSAEVGEKKTP